jgi:hypothetical protein
MSARQRSTASRGLDTAEGDDDEGVYQEQHPVTLGSHQTSVGRSQVHCTPRWILERLGPFDLDPCAADPRPWDCAAENWTTGGLGTPWHGRVWLNPPFDRYEVGRWIARLAQHGNGTALLHARTEAGWFEPIWESSTAILFMADRIKFCRPDGSEQPANSGAPPVLVAFGDPDAEKLEQSGVAGSLVTRWNWQPRACAQLRSHAHA